LAKMKGKVVLVDFWASWCPPCRVEAPKVKAVHDKLHDKGFEIVGISLDRKREPFDDLIKKVGMTWPQYFDGKGWDTPISRRYGIKSIPAMWLVDKEGNLVDKNARKDLESKVEVLLGIKVAEVVGEITKVEPGESVINVEERIQEITEQSGLGEDKLKQAFDEISKAGDAGLPAIEAFLGQGLDLDFKNYPSTLRRELLKICVKINSPDVEKVLAKVLRQTGVAEEVVIIASGLQKISPDKHTEAILDACKAILNSPPEGFTKEQRSLLEAVLAKHKAPSP